MQGYVVAPALVGVHHPGASGGVGQRASWGEAMVVGPWGEVLGRCESFDELVGEGNGGKGEEEGGEEGGGMESICVAEVDLQVVERVRREVPLLRRL